MPFGSRLLAPPRLVSGQPPMNRPMIGFGKRRYLTRPEAVPERGNGSDASFRETLWASAWSHGLPPGRSVRHYSSRSQ